MRDAFWPALIAASDTRLGAATRALAAGRVDPDIFELSGEPSYTRLRYRTADWRWHDGPRRRVRINHNGLSFARLDFHAAGGDVTDVALALPGRPAIVRVDWVEMRVIADGDAVPRVARWEEPEDFGGLVLAACTWLGGTMLEFECDDSAVWFPVGARVGAPVSSGRLTVAFAMLPKSRTGLGHRMPPASRLRRMSNRLREEYRSRGPVGVAASVARVAARQIRSGQ
jgi:hypothetical protein